MRGRSRIHCFTNANSCVAAESSSVQQDRCWRRATNVHIAAACFVCFEPKAVKNRPRVGVTLAKDDAVKGAVVEVKIGDVKVARCAEPDVYVGAG